MAITEASVFRDVSLIKTFLCVLLVFEVQCLEKTLRKIVRNQSKMVQRPFSDPGPDLLNNHSTSVSKSTQHLDPRNHPGLAQMKTVYYKRSGPSISTIISSVDTTKSKSSPNRYKIFKQDSHTRDETRSIRNIEVNTSLALPIKSETMYQVYEETSDNSSISDINELNKTLQTTSVFFPLPSGVVEINHHDENNYTVMNTPSVHTSLISKGVVPPNVSLINATSLKIIPVVEYDIDENVDSMKTEYLVDDHPPVTRNTVQTPVSPTCARLHEQIADFDAQTMFTNFNIEPTWTSRKGYWNHMFDTRYDSLMRNPKWPPLKVILIPRTQIDSIWKKSFESYHNNIVSKILSNVVKKLQFYSNLTFTWNEVSHLSRWWKYTTQKNRMGFRRLLKEGRIEITTGGWVEPDEATSHVFGLVHQLLEGHQWLKTNLNYIPEIAWLTNSVSHSPTMSYLLSASGITYMVLTNLHFAWEEWLAEYQYSDFIWLQNWQNDNYGLSYLDEPLNRLGNKRLPEHAVFTHFMQFNSAGFKACGPNAAVCMDFNFANKSQKKVDIHSYNIKDKAETLLEQYSKSGTITPHNIIVAPIGGPYRYEYQPEFDFQYSNYEKLLNYVNSNQHIYNATLEFGIPKTYFLNVLERHKSYPTVRGDFLNFAEISTGSPAYWAGYFTSRPLFKILLRRLQSTLRTTEVLFALASNLNSFHDTNVTVLFPLLIKARETVALLMDRHSVGGTLTKSALKYAHQELSNTVKNCWYIQEVTLSNLAAKNKIKGQLPYLHKYVYREGEFVSTFRTVIPNDKIYVFNSLTYERMEIVELTSRYPNIRIVDHLNKDVIIQVNPVWKYNTDNYITISKTFYKISFMAVIPPMTIKLFKIKETYDATQNTAVLYCLECTSEDADTTNFYPFKIKPVERGDIQIESYKLRLTFDEDTGFLKSLIDKETNTEKSIVINYSAFKSSDLNSGMFLFNTNSSKPIYDILKPFKLGIINKIIFIIVGDITTDFTVVYGRLLKHTTRVFNVINNPFSKALFIESQVDYEYSPKNRELEVFMSIQTNIANGDTPEIVTDNNSFQYTARKLNISRRIESNLYPFTSIAYIQDNKNRLNLITDHAQGVTAMQEGEIIVVLDRRVLYNDGRGNNEGLADSSKTYHRHFLLLENLNRPDESKRYRHLPQNTVPLPSFAAYYLSNSLNYELDMFIISRNLTSMRHEGVIPLIKGALPCDVLLLNFRSILTKGMNQRKSPNSALLILHRQTYSCQIDNFPHPPCRPDEIFTLENVLYYIRMAYKTLLGGTNKGNIVRHIDYENLPPMEIATFRIYF